MKLDDNGAALSNTSARHVLTAGRVLVVGAGPVGLVAALRLAQLGVAVTVLERRPNLSAASRASTLHSPTLEAFATLGIIDFALAHGHTVERIHYYAQGALVADFDLGLLASDTPYPHRLHLEQSEIARRLQARLAEHAHAEMMFDAEVVDMTQDNTGVAAVLRNGQVIVGAYLLAADGARSQVRTALGIAFDGEDYASRVLRVMTPHNLAHDIVPGCASVAYLFDGADSCSLLRMPDLWRIIFRVGAEESDEQALDPVGIRQKLARFLPGGAELPIASTDIYGVSRRVAFTFRHGRVLIAGDAAHVTNTRGGMNMNAGIHDAMAAAEALAAGTEVALSFYAHARHAMATEKLIPRTDRTVAGGTAWLERVRATAGDPAAARTFLLGTSMLDMTTAIPVPA